MDQTSLLLENIRCKESKSQKSKCTRKKIMDQRIGKTSFAQVITQLNLHQLVFRRLIDQRFLLPATSLLLISGDLPFARSMDEMQRVYQKELGPQPIPLVVPGEAIDEEYMRELMTMMNKTRIRMMTEISLKTKRVTRVVLNRRARRKELLKMEAEAKKLKGLSKDIDSLNHIMQEIAKEDDEKDKRHLPRIVAKQERLKTRPSRFEKYKFEPAPLQVLLTEEKIGSLRQLKGCCMLVRDRFKSLVKRGSILPTQKGSRCDEDTIRASPSWKYKTSLEDMNMDEASEERKAILEVIKETVRSHLTKKFPPHVQVVVLLCRTPQKESGQELLRRVAAGGGVFQGENGTKVHLPGANLNDIANQADDLLETMESRLVIPDRKLLARLVLIREEARNMMGGGILDERNDCGLNTLPESEVNFLTKMVALRPGKTVRDMIKNVMQGKDKGAENSENEDGSDNGRTSGISGMASVSGRKPLPVRPGNCLQGTRWHIWRKYFWNHCTTSRTGSSEYTPKFLKKSLSSSLHSTCIRSVLQAE